MSLMTMIVKMGEGLGKTCAIFFLTLLFSLPLGMIVALLRMSRIKAVSSLSVLKKMMEKKQNGLVVFMNTV